METSQGENPAHPNAAALAWLDAWYATPDTKPPGYWESFILRLEGYPLVVGNTPEQGME